jgi:hypothetical protein
MFLRASFGRRSFRGERAEMAADAILMAGASEVLVASSAELPAALERIPARTRVEDWVWTRDFAVPLVERQLGVRSLEGYGLVGHEAAAIAAGAVLHYVRTTQKNEALHVDSLRFEEHSTALELDQVTVRNLELVEPLFVGQDSRATLFHTLDECQTPMGKRLLRATILRPLVDAKRWRLAMRRWARRMGPAAAGGDSAGIWGDSGPGTAAGAAEPGLGWAARCARVGGEPAQAAGFEDGTGCDDGGAMAGCERAARCA